MNPLESFTIPVKGLKNGIHEFSFILDTPFFDAVNEDNEIKANMLAEVRFDKRPSMYILEIIIGGTVRANCDRCLENIDVPMESVFQLYIKLGSAEEEADVVYLEKFDDSINIAKYIFDYAVISIPLMKLRDCDEDENPPCNFEILDKWESQNEIEEETETKGSIWDELNNLNLDK